MSSAAHADPHAADILLCAGLPVVLIPEEVLQQGGWLQRDPWTRMAWQRAGRGAKLFVSGEAHPLPLADARRIANGERLDGDDYARLSITGRDLVQELLHHGHYALEVPDATASMPDGV